MSWKLIEIPRTGSTAAKQAIGQGVQSVRHLPASCFPDVDHLVAVIRDPFDRAVSACVYTCSGELMDTPDYFRRWVMDGIPYNGATLTDTHQTADTLINRVGAWIMCQQVTWLDDRVDLVRYEDLPGGLERWCGANGVQWHPMEHVNVSRRMATAAYYDDATRDVIEQSYCDDLELWRSLG